MSIINVLTALLSKTDSLANAKAAMLHSPALTKIMFFITNIGSTISMLVLSVLVIGFLAYKKRWQNICLFAAGMAGGLILELLLKMLVHRVRPENSLINEVGYSFPSGHATLAIIFFSLLIYIFRDDIKKELWKHVFMISCIVLALLIGFSRIYLNVHWLSDVIGGFALGLLWLSITIAVSKVIFKNKKPTENKDNIEKENETQESDNTNP